MKRDENGYIVVETIGCFVLFVLLIGSILSLINVVAVQARMHYAITQAAETVSMYCYTLEVAGISDEIMTMAGKKENLKSEVEKMEDNITGLFNGIQNLNLEEVGTYGSAAGQQAQGWIDDTMSDPKRVLQDFVQAALSDAGDWAFSAFLHGLIERYLGNGMMTGEQYLESAGVSDVDFFDPIKSASSSLLTSDGNVKIVVSYDINLDFFAAVLPFADPKIHVVQEVTTKAWLGGITEK